MHVAHELRDVQSVLPTTTRATGKLPIDKAPKCNGSKAPMWFVATQKGFSLSGRLDDGSVEKHVLVLHHVHRHRLELHLQLLHEILQLHLLMLACGRADRCWVHPFFLLLLGPTEEGRS